jgi:hypothetical protein
VHVFSWQLKTLGESGTGTVNLFLVGLLKVEKVPSEGNE